MKRRAGARVRTRNRVRIGDATRGGCWGKVRLAGPPGPGARALIGFGYAFRLTDEPGGVLDQRQLLLVGRRIAPRGRPTGVGVRPCRPPAGGRGVAMVWVRRRTARDG